MEAAIEGFWGARYRFTRYHAGDPDPLESLTIVVATEEVPPGERGLERGRVIADATRLARDLSNEPAGALTPVQLAEVAVEIAERGGLEATILDEAAIAEAGLGGLLGAIWAQYVGPRVHFDNNYEVKIWYNSQIVDPALAPVVAGIRPGKGNTDGGLAVTVADPAAAQSFATRASCGGQGEASKQM